MFTFTSSDGSTPVVTYALSLAGPQGTSSGLTSGGLSIFLYDIGGVIFGSTAADVGDVDFTTNTIFTISVDGNGVVTQTQLAEIDHAGPGDTSAPYNDQIAALGPGLVNLTATATIPGPDGTNVTASATFDLDGNIQFLDDGPSITASTAPVPPLVTDDTNTPNDIAGPVSFAALFTSAFGADGFKDADHNNIEDADAIRYVLNVSSTGGVESGLIDSVSGDKIYLFKEGGQVVGRVGLDDNGGADPTGAIAFTISVDANSGAVTLEQDRSVVHNNPADPIESGASAAVLVGSNLVTLTATIEDGDGDTANTTRDITTAFAFEDDGPSITASAVPVPTLVTDDTDTPDDVAGPVSFAALFTPDLARTGSRTPTTTTSRMQTRSAMR